MSASRNLILLSLIIALVPLSGCGRSVNPARTTPSSIGLPHIRSQSGDWRAKEERRCLALNLVKRTSFHIERPSIDGPGRCGAIHPFRVTAAMNGRVALQPAALLRCEMIPALDIWMATVVEPMAQRYYRMPVVELKVAASYSCRGRNGIPGAKLSEHGHANAIDISRFKLADGRWISVKKDWWGSARDRTFLRQVHKGACGVFTTVLGPLADRYHRDHFHLDLARHGRKGTYHFCQ
ncbi:MAG: extensin family protein [Hyphomicrobiaceae bacterium]